MQDAAKTKAQLMTELAELRQRVKKLEANYQRAEMFEQTCCRFVEMSSDGIVLVDEEGLIIEWSRGQEEITGLKRIAAIGRPAWDVQWQMIPEPAKIGRGRFEIEARLRDYFNTGRAVWLDEFQEVTLQRPDGTHRVIQQLAFPVETDRGFMLGSIMRDVTRYTEAEAALKVSQEYAQNIIDCSLDMIITVDMERRIVEFNQAAEKTFGYYRAEVIGQHVDLLYADPLEIGRAHV